MIMDAERSGEAEEEDKHEDNPVGKWAAALSDHKFQTEGTEL